MSKKDSSQRWLTVEEILTQKIVDTNSYMYFLNHNKFYSECKYIYYLLYFTYYNNLKQNLQIQGFVSCPSKYKNLFLLWLIKTSSSIIHSSSSAYN